MCTNLASVQDPKRRKGLAAGQKERTLHRPSRRLQRQTNRGLEAQQGVGGTAGGCSATTGLCTNRWLTRSQWISRPPPTGEYLQCVTHLVRGARHMSMVTFDAQQQQQRGTAGSNQRVARHCSDITRCRTAMLTATHELCVLQPSWHANYRHANCTRFRGWC